MKKTNLKSLKLKKNVISKFAMNSLKGGVLASGGHSGCLDASRHDATMCSYTVSEGSCSGATEPTRSGCPKE